ncbi:MAG: GTPase ObgE [Aestuariivita sp.]|nr:GTPase ObgE [Aestuariivita sp.]MCY4201618.1 GTPase ObgE [Aestuariivita sp.]
MKFLDLARVHVRSGSGGSGCISFRREKFVEFGGPDGGDGGDGGSVHVVAVDSLNTLVDYRYQQHHFAEDGTSGSGKRRTGRNGNPVTLRVPIGTEVLDEDQSTIIADLAEEGDSIEVARGGKGGFGNFRYKSSTNQAPRQAQPGRPGIERTLWLRLKLIADVGLIGLPNSGKSTFLATVTNARPKIASYPFTTLHPGLGVVRIDNQEFILADVPGLISGAHQGKGIGHRFLAHVERCSVLLQIVDCSSDTVLEDYRALLDEIRAYGHQLNEKPRVVALSKVDTIPLDRQEQVITKLKQSSAQEIYTLSSVTGQGVDQLIRRLSQEVSTSRHRSEELEGTREWYP